MEIVKSETFQSRLDGSVYAISSAKELSGNYPSTDEYFKARYQHDKQAFFMCATQTIGLLNKMIRLGYYHCQVGMKKRIIMQLSEELKNFFAHSPEKQEEAVSLMLTAFPLLARSGSLKYDEQILEAVDLIQAYYDRYLEPHAVYNNSFLTA